MSSRAIVVVTRVAVGGKDALGDLDPENKDRATLANAPGRDFPSDEYIDERAKILEQISAKALRCTRVPFEWVWLSHEACMDHAKENRDRIFPEAHVVEQSMLSHDAVTPGADNFLTVRLDSDDAISPIALSYIDGEELAANTIVNWRQGYRLNWNTGELVLKEWPHRTQGPFLAVTHDGRDSMLDFGGPHTYARKDRKVVHIDGRHWIQTIHNRNQLSKWRNVGESVPTSVLSTFGIEELAHA